MVLVFDFKSCEPWSLAYLRAETRNSQSIRWPWFFAAIGRTTLIFSFCCFPPGPLSVDTIEPARSLACEDEFALGLLSDSILSGDCYTAQSDSESIQALEVSTTLT